VFLKFRRTCSCHDAGLYCIIVEYGLCEYGFNGRALTKMSRTVSIIFFCKLEQSVRVAHLFSVLNSEAVDVYLYQDFGLHWV